MRAQRAGRVVVAVEVEMELDPERWRARYGCSLDPDSDTLPFLVKQHVSAALDGPDSPLRQVQARVTHVVRQRHYTATDAVPVVARGWVATGGVEEEGHEYREGQDVVLEWPEIGATLVARVKGVERFAMLYQPGWVARQVGLLVDRDLSSVRDALAAVRGEATA